MLDPPLSTMPTPARLKTRRHVVHIPACSSLPIVSSEVTLEHLTWTRAKRSRGKRNGTAPVGSSWPRPAEDDFRGLSRDFGMTRAAQIEALSARGPFRVWRVRAPYQGSTSHLLVNLYARSFVDACLPTTFFHLA
jgi:hypothetical protein